MMKNYFFAFVFVIASLTFPQSNKIYLTGSTDDAAMNPFFSPDGQKIAYTKSGYTGLWIYDLIDKSTKKITDEAAAGFGYKWSYDSEYILCRVAEYREQKRFNAIKFFNVTTGEAKQLTEYRTMMPALPDWAYFDEKVFLCTNNYVEFFETGIKVQGGQMRWKKPDIIYLNGNNIEVMNLDAETKKIYSPFKDVDYINLSVSPNNSKIVFEVMGGNMFTMNIDGTNLVDIGKGNRPRWSADSKKIIYMISQDDGHEYTASDIYSINPDGTQKINLTNTDDLIEMNPCFSLDGKSIVFEVYNDGSIYLMNID
jgi:Tol biopolymer transport system component